MAVELGVRGTYPKGDRRRRQIIEVAARVFAQHGYKGGTLRHIAGEVGVTNAALISHFGHKEGLLTAVLEYWAEESARFRRPYPGMEYFRALPELMKYHTAHRGLIELFLTLATEASNVDHPARTFIVERYEATIAESTRHLREAVEAGEVSLQELDAESEARALTAVMDGLELQWLLNPSIDLVGLFVDYLQKVFVRWGAA